MSNFRRRDVGSCNPEIALESTQEKILLLGFFSSVQRGLLKKNQDDDFLVSFSSHQNGLCEDSETLKQHTAEIDPKLQSLF
jgi:hypothetical protein